MIHEQGTAAPGRIHVEVRPDLVGYAGKLPEVVNVACLCSAGNPNHSNELGWFSDQPVFLADFIDGLPEPVDVDLVRAGVSRNMNNPALADAENGAGLADGVMAPLGN